MLQEEKEYREKLHFISSFPSMWDGLWAWNTFVIAGVLYVPKEALKI